MNRAKAALRQITPPIFWKAAKRLRSPSEGDLSLKIGSVSIDLPPTHALPGYMQSFRNYDRFLPMLVRELAPQTWVLDVGANCGDTLAGMVAANAQLNFLCVEADDYFFEYLLRNTRKIRSAYPELGRIECVKSLAGTEGLSGELAGSAGTKHLVAGIGSRSAKPLDVIVRESLPCDAAISLIKVDVDGFDFDVLRSAGTLVDIPGMLLYFECAFVDECQKHGYADLLAELIDRQFTLWVFDNFGTPLLSTRDLQVISALLHYIWRQNMGEATRTIFYFDMLASRPVSAHRVDRALARFPFAG